MSKLDNLGAFINKTDEERKEIVKIIIDKIFENLSHNDYMFISGVTRLSLCSSFLTDFYFNEDYIEHMEAEYLVQALNTYTNIKEGESTSGT